MSNRVKVSAEDDPLRLLAQDDDDLIVKPRKVNAESVDVDALLRAADAQAKSGGASSDLFGTKSSSSSSKGIFGDFADDMEGGIQDEIAKFEATRKEALEKQSREDNERRRVAKEAADAKAAAEAKAKQEARDKARLKSAEAVEAALNWAEDEIKKQTTATNPEEEEDIVPAPKPADDDVEEADFFGIRSKAIAQKTNQRVSLFTDDDDESSRASDKSHSLKGVYVPSQAVTQRTEAEKVVNVDAAATAELLKAATEVESLDKFSAVAPSAETGLDSSLFAGLTSTISPSTTSSLVSPASTVPASIDDDLFADLGGSGSGSSSSSGSAAIGDDFNFAAYISKETSTGGKGGLFE